MSLLNFFKKHYLVTITELNRSGAFSSQTCLVRAWTGWGAFDIATKHAESKPEGANGKWVVYDMKKL